MESASPIASLGEDDLADRVNAAKKSVFFMAPGISKTLSEAICGAWFRLGRDAVKVIVDVDSAPCRLGYGTIEGLKKLKETADNLHAGVDQKEGIRIGVLICDGVVIVFSPTPLRIEAGSEHSGAANAVVLGETGDLNPGKIESKPLDEEKLEVVENEIAANPVDDFDLTRKSMVYSTHLQFVELEMQGCAFSDIKARIPSEFLGLVDDGATHARITAQYSLLAEKDSLEVIDERNVDPEKEPEKLTEKSLKEKRKKIVEDYLFSTGCGMAVMKIEKRAFDNEVRKLKRDVEAFQNGIEEQLQEQINASVERLIEIFLPIVMRNPPNGRYRVAADTNDSDLAEWALRKDFHKSFGLAQGYIDKMKVTLIYKDVTYEALNNEKFIRTIERAKPELRRLHDESVAVKAKRR